jgi:cytohesin
MAGHLLDKGARIKFPVTKVGTPALSEAISRRCDLKMIRILLGKGADPNALDETGQSPLIAALLINRRDIGSELLTAGADANKADTQNKAPIEVAIEQKRVRLLKLLLKHGATLDVKDRDDPLALRAARAGWWVGVAVLMRHDTTDGWNKIQLQALSDCEDRAD